MRLAAPYKTPTRGRSPSPGRMSPTAMHLTVIDRKDVDLLALVREESRFALRVRDALVSAEAQIGARQPALLYEPEGESAGIAFFETARGKRRICRDERPKRHTGRRTPRVISDDSEASRPSSEEVSKMLCDDIPTSPILRDTSSVSPTHKTQNLYKADKTSYVRSVPAEDVLFGKVVDDIPFSYGDLLRVVVGLVKIKARTLRQYANMWNISPQLRKSAMISELMREYARRYPEEVAKSEAEFAKEMAVARGKNRRGNAPKKRFRAKAR